MFQEALSALRLTVKIDGKDFAVHLKPGDLVRFEARFDKAVTDLANEDGTVNLSLQELLFLSFTALSREGAVDGDFDAFLDRVDDVSVAEGDDPAPLGEAPSPA